MCYNPIELEVWKMRIAKAERKAMFDYQTSHIKSPEMLERLRCGARLLFTMRPLPSLRLWRYSVQQE